MENLFTLFGLLFVLAGVVVELSRLPSHWVGSHHVVFFFFAAKVEKRLLVSLAFDGWNNHVVCLAYSVMADAGTRSVAWTGARRSWRYYPKKPVVFTVRRHFYIPEKEGKVPFSSFRVVLSVARKKFRDQKKQKKSWVSHASYIYIYIWKEISSADGNSNSWSISLPKQ